MTKLLISNHVMHNLYARFVKILEICKKIGKDLVNKEGNIPRRGVVPKFSDLEVLSLSMTSESLGIDSEAYLFSILKGYKKRMVLRHFRWKNLKSISF